MNKRLLPWIRKNLKKIAGYGAGGAMALVLAGCATTPTTSSTSLAACKSLTNVTVALTQVKPLMSPTVQKQTTTALETAVSYCTTPQSSSKRQPSGSGNPGQLEHPHSSIDESQINRRSSEMTTETTNTVNPTAVAEGETLATAAAGVAGVASGNPEIVPLTIAAEALVNAIMNIQQASAAKGTMSTAELDAQWAANSKALGIALKEFIAAP